MRSCPKCQVAFEVVRTTFAEIDLCPRCGGVFLDPGEGVATDGADSDGSFLVTDGRAKLLRTSEFKCPSTAHHVTTMNLYTIGDGSHAIEFEHCPACQGYFLDKGEGPALEALDALEGVEVTSGTGARFEAPPMLDNQSLAADRIRATGTRSFFRDFVVYCLEIAAQGVIVVGAGTAASRHRRRRGIFDGTDET